MALRHLADSPASPRSRGWTRAFARLHCRESDSAASPRSRGWTRARKLARSRPPAPGLPRARGDGPQPALPGTMPAAAWLPRARGDGPGSWDSRKSRRSASPRSRGWTLLVEDALARRRGFPALAGMDPCPDCPSVQQSRLPRARGDGPVLGFVHAITGVASPRSRGWTRQRPERHRRGPGFPALAGMDRVRRADRRFVGGLPRARGDGPPLHATYTPPTAASPRSRGWTCPSRPRRTPSGGFPALAGMDPSCRAGCGPRRWLPRARGDGPGTAGSGTGAASASPRSRGWTRSPCPPNHTNPGFPALAGMDPPLRPRSPCRGRLPRARGDGPWTGPIRA